MPLMFNLTEGHLCRCCDHCRQEITPGGGVTLYERKVVWHDHRRTPIEEVLRPRFTKVYFAHHSCAPDVIRLAFELDGRTIEPAFPRLTEKVTPG